MILLIFTLNMKIRNKIKQPKQQINQAERKKGGGEKKKTSEKEKL